MTAAVAGQCKWVPGHEHQPRGLTLPQKRNVFPEGPREGWGGSRARTSGRPQSQLPRSITVRRRRRRPDLTLMPFQPNGPERPIEDLESGHGCDWHVLTIC